MQTTRIPKHSTRRAAEPANHRVKRWILKRVKRGACILESASARYVNQSRWDRVVLFMFICCLVTFLRALGGFGGVNNTPRQQNHTPLAYPSTPSPFSPMSQRNIVTSSNKNRALGAKGVTRVMVGWHGEYELFPSMAPTSNPPPSIPQDAFPDPTPVSDGGPVLDIPLSMTSSISPTMDFSAALHGMPYDPFRLDFEDFSGDEPYGLYPVAEPPSTARQNARKRRFGRCVVGEDCM